MTGIRLVADYLDDICDACQKAETFVGQMSLEAFAADDRTTFAVMRALEVIGVAAKRIPQSIREEFADVPWRSMTGMRDKLSHDYLTVNLEVVWRTVKEDLPPLITRLRIVASEVRARESDRKGS